MSDPLRSPSTRPALAPRRAGVLALLLALAACAGPPRVPVAEGDRVLVTLFDAEGGLSLVLANATHPEYRDVYSQKRDAPFLKLAPDDLMERLLGDLDAEGLDRWGVAAGRPGPGRGYLLVDRGPAGATLFEEPRPGSTPDEARAFVRMKLLVDEYYSVLGSLQFVDNPRGADFFREDG